MVQQSRLRHHKRSDAGGGHHGAAAPPLSKCIARISDIRPRERPLQRTRHLEPDGRDNNAIGRPPADGMNWHAEALRGLHCLSHANDPCPKSWRGDSGQFNQFICSLKRIEDCRQAQVKDPIESEDVYPHGKNDTQYGVPAPSAGGVESLLWDCAIRGAEGDMEMLTVSLFARLEAKPGKEEEVAAFLDQGRRPRCGLHCDWGRPRLPYLMRSTMKRDGRII